MRQLFKFPRILFRYSSTKSNRVLIYPSEKPKDENSQVSNSLKAFKAKQRHFQKDDGLPIFLKNGASDRALFYLTLGLACFGLINVAAYIYQSAFPNKNNQRKMEVVEI